MVQDIRAWETEDASFIVLGTHDPVQAVPAMLAYCLENGFDKDSEEFTMTLDRVQNDQAAMRWVPGYEVDKEVWKHSKPLHNLTQDEQNSGKYLPYLMWY